MKRFIGLLLLSMVLIVFSANAEVFSLHNGTKFGMSMEEVVNLESQNGVTLNAVAYNDYELVGSDTIANCPDTKISYTFAEDGRLQSLLYTFQTTNQRDLLEAILAQKYGDTAFNSTTHLSFPCVDSNSWENTPFTFSGQYGIYEQKRADFSHRLVFTSDHKPVLIEHFVGEYYSHFAQPQIPIVPDRLENMIRYTLLNPSQAELILSAISSIEDDL